jgi:hypothetical protein
MRGLAGQTPAQPGFRIARTLARLIWARAIGVEFRQMARAGLASRTSEPLKVHRSARSYSL